MLHAARRIAAFGLRTSVDALAHGLNALDATAHGVERVCFALTAAETRLLGGAAPDLALDLAELGEPAPVLVGVTDPVDLAQRIGAVWGARAGAG